KEMVYEVPARVRENAKTPITDLDRYRATWAQAAADPDGFWLAVAKEHVRWRTAPTLGSSGGFDQIADGPLAWFSDGTLNVTETCVDQHLDARGDKVAILWEGDEPGNTWRITYRELHRQV